MPYQMPNGKWRGKRMIQGQVKTKVFPTKATAKRWETEQNLESWIEQETPTDTDLSALEWGNAYLDFAGRFVKKTVDEKRDAFKCLFAKIPLTTTAKDITVADALAVLSKIATERTGNAANKARKNLGAAWAWGVKYLALPAINPFLQVDKFPADKKKRYVPTEADLEAVIEAASERDRMLLTAFLHTAARRGELFRLTWADVDFDGRKIRLSTKKRSGGGMEHDWIPMTEKLREELVTLRKQNMSSVLVFPSPKTGGEYRERGRLMPHLCKEAKVKPFGFHAIRHLTASMLARANVPIREIQEILRHRNPNTTARYLHSLSGTSDALTRLFDEKKKAPKVVPFEASKKVIGT